jgi:hypothetical protein
MEDFKFRTISREELEVMYVADEHKSERIKNVFQIIGASFLCIISLAFIAVFIFLFEFENFRDAPKTFKRDNFNSFVGGINGSEANKKEKAGYH